MQTLGADVAEGDGLGAGGRLGLYSVGIHSGKRPRRERPRTTTTTANFPPTTIAAVFQVHQDPVDFWEVKSESLLRSRCVDQLLSVSGGIELDATSLQRNHLNGFGALAGRPIIAACNESFGSGGV